MVTNLCAAAKIAVPDHAFAPDYSLKPPVSEAPRRVAVLNPKHVSMSDTVAVMTGAMRAEDLSPDALA